MISTSIWTGSSHYVPTLTKSSRALYKYLYWCCNLVIAVFRFNLTFEQDESAVPASGSLKVLENYEVPLRRFISGLYKECKSVPTQYRIHREWRIDNYWWVKISNSNMGFVDSIKRRRKSKNIIIILLIPGTVNALGLFEKLKNIFKNCVALKCSVLKLFLVCAISICLYRNVLLHLLNELWTNVVISNVLPLWTLPQLNLSIIYSCSSLLGNNLEWRRPENPSQRWMNWNDFE